MGVNQIIYNYVWKTGQNKLYKKQIYIFQNAWQFKFLFTKKNTCQYAIIGLPT